MGIPPPPSPQRSTVFEKPDIGYVRRKLSEQQHTGKEGQNVNNVIVIKKSP